MVETSTISVKFLNFLSLQAALRSLAMVLTSRDGRVVKARNPMGYSLTGSNPVHDV